MKRDAARISPAAWRNVSPVTAGNSGETRSRSGSSASALTWQVDSPWWTLLVLPAPSAIDVQGGVMMQMIDHAV